MSLLEELKEKLQTVCAEQDEQLAKIRVHEAFLGAAMQDIRDLSRAIAALEPSAVEGSSVAAYFDARRAEALLDPQPEADAPEFASEQDEDDEDAPKGCAPPELQQILADALAAAERTSVVTDQDRVKLQIPEGFTPWGGGECPVELDAHIRLVMDNGYVSDHDDAIAGHFNWAHDETCGVGARIIAYRIIEASTQSRAFMVANGAEVRTAFPAADEESRDTLITDDIPSIPREEIPIGAAVETYTDSGLETVKISGTTYVVDDEPERQAETQPEAAYAPVNEDEGLMWSNGFEADAKSKAETEQDKRPFWTRAPKPKVIWRPR